MVNYFSPCISVCRLENNICIGCYRTSKEIFDWITYPDHVKQQILDKLEDRKAVINECGTSK